MRRIVTILGAALLSVSAVQMASAGQRDKARQVERTYPTQSQQFRDSNAYYVPNDTRGFRDDSYGYGYNNRLQSLYEGGAISAPAGR